MINILLFMITISVVTIAFALILTMLSIYITNKESKNDEI